MIDDKSKFLGLKGAIVVGFIVLVGLYVALSASEEELILETLDEVQSLAEIRPEETPFEVLERSAKLIKHFEDSVLLEYPSQNDSSELEHRVVSLKDKRKVKDQTVAASKFFKELRFDIRERKIDVQSDSAVATVLVNVVGAVPGEEDIFFESHRYELTFSKQSGNWRIARAKHLANERE